VRSNGSARPRYDGRTKAQPPPETDRLSFLDHTLYAGENRLAGGTSLASGRLAQAAMQFARQVDAGTDGKRSYGFQSSILAERLK
jgi:hypothetical protein